MDKEFEDKGNDDLEDLNNIIFTDTAEEAEQAEDIISSPAPAASYNTSGGASAQPDSARGPEGEQAAGSAHQPTGGAYTFHRPEYNAAKPPKKWKIVAIISIIAAVILAVSACAASMITGGSGVDANYGGGSSYIGVLHAEGTITTSSSSSDTYQQSWLLRQIDYMKDDTSNRGIMLYVNSPGGSVYAYREGVWVLIYTFTGGLTGGRVDFTEARIDATDYLLIASGEQQIVKYNGAQAALFGSSDGLSDKPVSYLAAYRSRLFAAGDSSCPNRLYWSKLPGGSRTIESWGEESGSVNVSGGHTEIGASAGDPIVGLAALSNQLLIFKKRSLYRLIGDKPSNFTVERIDSDVETAAYTSLVMSGDMLYFMTKGGLCRFNGVSAALMSDARRIKKLLSGADVSLSKGAAARSKLYY